MADKHWQRVGSALNAKGTSIHSACPSRRSLFQDIVSHIMRFCAGEGCALVDGRDLGLRGSTYVLGREGEMRGNGPDDANNIILVK